MGKRSYARESTQSIYSAIWEKLPVKETKRIGYAFGKKWTFTHRNPQNGGYLAEENGKWFDSKLITWADEMPKKKERKKA